MSDPFSLTLFMVMGTHDISRLRENLPWCCDKIYLYPPLFWHPDLVLPPDDDQPVFAVLNGNRIPGMQVHPVHLQGHVPGGVIADAWT